MGETPKENEMKIGDVVEIDGEEGYWTVTNVGDGVTVANFDSSFFLHVSPEVVTVAIKADDVP